jgi:hypothetical protein
MWKYIATSFLFLFNSEIVSLLALLLMVGMFIWQILIARSTCHNQ